MKRALVIGCLLVLTTLLVIPAVSAAPPSCVSVDPRYPNPVQIAPGTCEEFREYVCYHTIGRLIPYSCDQW